MRRALRVTCIATAVILLMMILSGCSRSPDYTYDGWKEVEIPGYGTIKMPVNWKACEKDGKLYLTDKPLDEPDCHIYFFQTNYDENTVVCGKTVRLVEAWLYEDDEVFGNGAIIFDAKFNVDGVTQTLDHFALAGASSTLPHLFLCTFDADISKETIRKIAKSYEKLGGE